MYTPNLTVLWSTPNPAEIAMLAARNTMLNIADALGAKDAPSSSAALLTSQSKTERLIRFAYLANHGSIFEHMSLSMAVTGVSRSFLTQITRHRHTAFTSSSQHYQRYDDYPVITHDSHLEASPVAYAARQAVEAYTTLVDEGVPHEEARQALPGASAVNLIMTTTAREWASILNLRLCKRNTQETLIWAREARAVLYNWFPELFGHVGPDCEETVCRQGHMRPAVCRG